MKSTIFLKKGRKEESKLTTTEARTRVEISTKRMKKEPMKTTRKSQQVRRRIRKRRRKRVKKRLWLKKIWPQESERSSRVLLNPKDQQLKNENAFSKSFLARTSDQMTNSEKQSSKQVTKLSKNEYSRLKPAHRAPKQQLQLQKQPNEARSDLSIETT